MKKIISVFLAIAILAVSLFVLPIVTSASDDIILEENLILSTTNSSTDTTAWVGPHKDLTATFSVVGGATRIGSALRGNEISGTGNFVSSPILEFNAAKVSKTSVKNFKWDFKTLNYGKTETKEDAAEGYFFRIGENADYTAITNWDGTYKSAGLSNIKNCFAVIYSRSGSPDGLKAQAFTVLQPEYDKDGNCLGLFPIKYTKNAETGEIIPDESSYLFVGDDIIIGSIKQFTLTLKDNVLEFKWDQSAAVDSWVSSYNNGGTKKFTLSSEALDKVPSGDFALYADRRDTSDKLMAFGAMTVTELSSVKKVTAFTTENANGIQWLAPHSVVSNTINFDTSKSTGTINQFNGTTNFISKPILQYNAENGMQNVDKDYVTDFDWTFNEVGRSTTWRRPDTLNVYFFHVGEDTDYSSISGYNNYNGDTVGFSGVKNCFAVVYSYKDTTDGLKAKAFTVLQPEYDNNGNCLGLFPIKYTKNSTTGAIIPDESSYLFVDDTGLRQEWDKNITITLTDNILTVKYNATQDGKSGSKNFKLSSESLAKAPKGDFAIMHCRDWDPDDNGVCESDDINESIYVCRYSDMKVTVSYNISSEENSAVDNSHSVLGDGNLTFEKAASSSGGIVSLMGERVVITAMKWDADANKYSSAFVTSKGVTGKVLTDYTLKYNYIVAGTGWNLDAVSLRIQNSANPDRTKGYNLVIQGTSFKVDGEKSTGSIITIQKDRCDSVSTLNVDSKAMSLVALDAPLTIGAEYTVEAEVKGGTVKVWLYLADSVKPSAPTISYTDPDAKYTSGDISFVARDEGYSISNISITDSAIGKICENWKPTIYNNALALNTSDFIQNVADTPYSTGVISVSNGKYRIISGNTLTNEVFNVKTNGFTQSKDYYFKNFELCYEVSFNGTRNNSSSVHFSARDYNDKDYELKLNGNGAVQLYKEGQLLAKANTEFISNMTYQVIVNVNDGVMKVYIYLLNGSKAKKPIIDVTDKSPLAAGYIFFGSEKGDFNISKIGVKSFDKATVKGPTGSIFSKNFEGDDKNLDGLSLSLLNSEHTRVVTGSNGNSFLRVVGTRTADPNDLTGTDALSQVKFGSDELYNFELTADVRVKSAFSGSWSYLAVGMHANPTGLRNNAVWLDVGTRGAAAIKLDTANGMSNTNIVGTTGVITGTQQSAFVPNNSQANGLTVDNRWHKLKVVVSENSYSLYIDGDFILTYTDPDNTYEKGSLYFYGYGMNYDLDNIKVINNSVTNTAKTVGKTVYSNNNEITLAASQKLSKLTGKQISEFEWQFEYKANSIDAGRTTFLFRVADKAKVKDNQNNYMNMANVFGFTLAGLNGGKTSEGIINNSINVFTPNPDPATDGNILPPIYKQASDSLTGEIIGPVVPDATTALSLDVLRWNNGNYKAPGVNMDDWMTVNVRLVGNKLVVRTWQTNDKSNTIRSRLFTLSADIIKEITKGDFMIVNGNSGAKIKNMVIRDLSGTYKAAQ